YLPYQFPETMSSGPIRWTSLRKGVPGSPFAQARRYPLLRIAFHRYPPTAATHLPDGHSQTTMIPRSRKHSFPSFHYPFVPISDERGNNSLHLRVSSLSFS